MRLLIYITNLLFAFHWNVAIVEGGYVEKNKFNKMDFTTNYCGMYWSDGKIQSSVENGKSEPVSVLDYYCKQHDEEYARSRSTADRRKADHKFYIANKGKGVKRNFYANLVKYVNLAMDPLSVWNFGLQGYSDDSGGGTPIKDTFLFNENEARSHLRSHKVIEALVNTESEFAYAHPILSGTQDSPIIFVEEEAPIIQSQENNFNNEIPWEKNKNKEIMANKQNKQTKKKPRKGRTKRTGDAGRQSASMQISTAPVSIGNTLRGAKPNITTSKDGARIIGRDLAFSLGSTYSTVVNWELIGGMPLTPCVMASSVMRSYCQMFAYFKFNRFALHYVTSSPTSQAGDIVFYYNKDTSGPLPDYSSTSFLPFLLADPSNVIGPQWSNHIMYGKPVSSWKSTNYLLKSDLNETSAGEVFVFSKTSSTNSPGYILIDYDIEFKQMSINPRAGLLPVTRGQYSNFSIGATGAIVVAGTNSLSLTNVFLTGKDLSNATSVLPNGASNGDVYRCVANVTSSLLLNTWTNVTTSNLLTYNNTPDVAVTIDDGFTFYVLLSDYSKDGTDQKYTYCYPTLEAAISKQNAFLYNVTATVTWALIVQASLVFTTAAGTQSSY